MENRDYIGSLKTVISSDPVNPFLSRPTFCCPFFLPSESHLTFYAIILNDTNPYQRLQPDQQLGTRMSEIKLTEYSHGAGYGCKITAAAGLDLKPIGYTTAKDDFCVTVQ